MAGNARQRAAKLALFGALGCGSAERALPSEDSSSGTGGSSSGGVAGFDGQAGRRQTGVGGSAVGPEVGMDPREPPPECQREVSLTAVTLEEPPPFDLILVADHSDSLSWSRDDLSAGLRNLLDNVKGRSVRVFLLTPTQYGASSALAQQPLTGTSIVAWQDPATGQAYSDPMTAYLQSCTDPGGVAIECPSSKGPAPYKAHGTWQFEMPEPVAVLLPDLDDAAFAEQRDRVSEAVLALSGGGSPDEQPLCTLARYFTQDRAAMPSHAVFLLITDEDDTSTPKECLATYDAELEVTRIETGSRPCSSGCDAYRYTVSGRYPWQRLEIDCAAFDDLGQQIPGSQKSTRLNEGVQAGCTGVSRPCTTEETARARPICDAGLEVVGCEFACGDSEGTCTLDRPDPSVDLCTQAFEEGGRRHDNLAKYCEAVRGGSWTTCSAGGISKEVDESMIGTYSPRPLMPGTATADVATHVRAQAVQQFGVDRYLVEAIVFDPSFRCVLNDGQSYAKNLVQFVADQGRAFPLCESYAPALDGIWDFAQGLLQTEYPLQVEDDEHVTAVIVIAADGSERALGAESYEFDETSRILSIDRAAIGATDTSLRVEVTSECRKIIE